MNKLKQCRIAAKMSQQGLADKVGCSQAAISHIEGGAGLRLILARRIAKALRQPIADIFPDVKANG